MKETRSIRFKRLAEARVNKIIKMVRLLGNLSVTTIYAYEPDQIVQIFTAIQDELNKARSRFYEAGKQSRKRRASPFLNLPGAFDFSVLYRAYLVDTQREEPLRREHRLVSAG